MLSRRNIRIKVLQTLYSALQDSELKGPQAVKAYGDLLERSRKMYLFSLHFLTQICKRSEDDLASKRKKYLPSEADKRFTAKLYDNELTQAIVTNKDFQSELTKLGLKELVDGDLAKRIYRSFRKKDEYVEYSQNPSVAAHHMVILLDLYKYMCKDEDFMELMDDLFSIWEDDKSLVIGAVKKTLKSLPDMFEIFKTFQPDREAAIEFGETLLQKVLEQSSELEGLIGPTLDNWDIDRVANVDKLLIKMAMLEFFEFESIPTKVTINEYVEIAKLYSTDKSKDFINGILDKLKEQLMSDGKIKKSGRGLVE